MTWSNKGYQILYGNGYTGGTGNKLVRALWFNVLALAHRGYAVLRDMGGGSTLYGEVTPNASSDLTNSAQADIDIAVGYYLYNGLRSSYISSASYDFSTYYSGLSSGQSRYVLVYVDPSTNTHSFLAGTPATTGQQQPPELPEDVVPLALIYLQYGDTVIDTNNIIDLRVTKRSYLFLPDNKYLGIGSSVDAKIYHNGSDTYIEHGGTGRLIIRVTNQQDLRFEVKGGGTTDGHIYYVDENNSDAIFGAFRRNTVGSVDNYYFELGYGAGVTTSDLRRLLRFNIDRAWFWAHAYKTDASNTTLFLLSENNGKDFKIGWYDSANPTYSGVIPTMTINVQNQSIDSNVYIHGKAIIGNLGHTSVARASLEVIASSSVTNAGAFWLSQQSTYAFSFFPGATSSTGGTLTLNYITRSTGAIYSTIMRWEPGKVTSYKDLIIQADRKQLLLGAGLDFGIYHDGANNILKMVNSTSNLHILDSGGATILEVTQAGKLNTVQQVYAYPLYNQRGSNVSVSTSSFAETSNYVIAMDNVVNPLANTMPRDDYKIKAGLYITIATVYNTAYVQVQVLVDGTVTYDSGKVSVANGETGNKIIDVESTGTSLSNGRYSVKLIVYGQGNGADTTVIMARIDNVTIYV